MIDLSKYPRMAAMLARRNPDRKPATPSVQPAKILTSRVQHFATEQARLDYEKYVVNNNDLLPF